MTEQIQQQAKSKERIPQFKDRDEEAQWWDTHDIADYWDEFTPVDIEFQLEKPKEENIVVRVQKPIKDRLEQIARRKGLNISSLTRMWIMEKLQATH
jgi:predicted DNA binding CopG/RHH family protein